MSKVFWYGCNAPFVDSSNRILPMQTDERLIKNDFIQLLLTAPGERVMRPTFGTILRTSVFEQLDDITKSAIISDIKNKADQFEGRILISNIVIEDFENQITVNIYGKISVDRFGRSTDSNVDLLVELNIPKGKTSPTLAGA